MSKDVSAKLASSNIKRRITLPRDGLGLIFTGHSAYVPKYHISHFCPTFQHYSLNKNDETSIQISLKLVDRNPIDNTLALVYAMDWRRKVNKPSSEPMMTQLTDAYMQH